MKQVIYVGEVPVVLPALGIKVETGNVITVPDDFENANFSLYEEDIK